MFGLKYLGRLAFFATIALFVCAIPVHSQCSPFQGLGATQFLGNDGTPLVNGVLYSFQAGTSTQQATFTDSTCTTQNVNPITFTTGARVNIWLTTGNFYKFQLCLQNDGSTCAASDVLFSVDQVPGGSSGGGGGGSPFTSSSPNPATAGILRCASGDQCVVFRNAANSANLAISKDTNDVLSWAGGSVKFPAVAAPTGLTTGLSWLWNDSTAFRWKVSNNGGTAAQLVISGVDINTSDQVTQLHFGATATPLGGTAPTTNQYLLFNGTNVVGVNQLEVFMNGAGTVSGNTTPCSTSVPTIFCQFYVTALPHTLTRLVVAVAVAPSGCSTAAVWGIKDQTASSVLASLTPVSVGILDSGALSVAMPASHQYSVGVTTQAVGCSTNPTASANATYQ